MSTTEFPSRSRVHPIVLRQEQFKLRRRLLRDGLLRPLGFGLLVRIAVEGREQMPATGPVIVIMNHIAAIDPLVVVGVVTHRFLVPMSKIENYRNPIVGLMARSWGGYPVRRGVVDRQALDSTLALLEQGYAVLIAPEGTRHAALADPKDGTTYVATKANAIIQPVGLDGTEQFPASLKRLRRAPVTVRFGRPFRFRTEGRTRVPREELRLMTQEMMYQLAALLPAHRRGLYNDLGAMTTERIEFLDGA